MKNDVSFSGLHDRQPSSARVRRAAGVLAVVMLVAAAGIAAAQDATPAAPAPEAKFSTPDGYTSHHAIDMGGRMTNLSGSGSWAFNCNVPTATIIKPIAGMRTQFHQLAAFFPRIAIRPVNTDDKRSFQVVGLDRQRPQALVQAMPVPVGSLEHYMPDLKHPESQGTKMEPVFSHGPEVARRRNGCPAPCDVGEMDHRPQRPVVCQGVHQPHLGGTCGHGIL